ncbi:MAG: hypothetical protein JWO70_2713 [Betaproteobacteria bacterium]|nr:hypothetical protein [Betaproteobacteria bacterium]
MGLRLIRAALLVPIFIFALALPAMAQEPRKLPLVDEGAGDVSWLRFKKRLQAAIDGRDKQFLLSILDRNVRNQTAKTRGIAEFRKQWELDTADTTVWRELQTALQLGAAYIKRDKGGRELCAPYVLGKWPYELEPFNHAVVISRDSTVQAEPSTGAAALGRLSYDIVEVDDWEVDDKADPKQKWVRVRYGNRNGYVLEEHVRSPIEQAACFVKAGSGWKMTGFAPAGGE